MSAEAATRPDFHCPDWCRHDHDTDRTVDWADPVHLSADLETAAADGGGPVRVGLGQAADGTFVDLNGSELTIEGAREVIRNIERVIELTGAPGRG